MDPLEQRLGILTTDTNLIVRTWDEWLERHTGITAESARGKSLSALAPDLISREWHTRLETVLKEGSVQVMAPALHHFLIPCRPGQPSRYFDRMQQRVTLAPLREGDRIVGTLITIEDVTQRLERERELAEQLASSDESVRLSAAEALAAEEHEDPSHMLVEALGDESWRVRRVAVNELARSGGPKSIEVLVRALKEEHHNASVLNSALQVLSMSGHDTLTPLVGFLQGPDPDLRVYSALALGEQNDPRAIAPLLQALQDPEPNVRYHAIESLGKLRARQAVAPLLEFVEARDFYLAFPALDALTFIGAREVVAQVLPLLQDELLCGPAARLVGELGDAGMVGVLVTAMNKPGLPAQPFARGLTALYERYLLQYQNGDVIADQVRSRIEPSGTESLLLALNEAAPDELRAIATVLGWLRGPAIEAALTRLLGQPSARNEVVDAMVRHGAQVIDLLVEALESKELDIRQAAIIALGRIGDARAVPALIGVLQSDPESAIVTAGALAKIGDRRAFEALTGQMGHPNPAVRQAIVSALNSIGHPDMCERMGSLLRDANPRVRESATRIAGYFGYEECTDQLLSMDHDPDEGVRRAVIESIAFLEDARARAVLFDAVKADVASVRAAAARSLAHVEGEEALTHLLGAARDGDIWVRYFAVRSLTHHPGPATMQVLAELAQHDPAPPVQLAAIASLGMLGADNATEILARLAQSPDPEIARAAGEALQSVRPLSQSAGHLDTGADRTRAA